MIFKMVDNNRTGKASQNTFVTRLDSMGLVEQLNDQELITIMRRFKDKDGTYLYNELCDFISHIYFFHPMREKEDAGSDAFELFRASARMRTLQWRRTFRNDPHVLKGHMTLAVMEKIMMKHKMASLPEFVKKTIKERYSVSAKRAIPILKDLYKIGAVDKLFTGYDEKVIKKGHKSFFKESLRRTLDASTSQLLLEGSSSQVYPIGALEPNTQANSEVLPESHNPSVSHPPGQSLTRKFSVLLLNKDDTKQKKAQGLDVTVAVNTTPANTIIDYNKLCDDIYQSDWLP